VKTSEQWLMDNEQSMMKPVRTCTNYSYRLHCNSYYIPRYNLLQHSPR